MENSPSRKAIQEPLQRDFSGRAFLLKSKCGTEDKKPPDKHGFMHEKAWDARKLNRRQPRYECARPRAQQLTKFNGVPTKFTRSATGSLLRPRRAHSTHDRS